MHGSIALLLAAAGSREDMCGSFIRLSEVRWRTRAAGAELSVPEAATVRAYAAASSGGMCSSSCVRSSPYWKICPYSTARACDSSCALHLCCARSACRANEIFLQAKTLQGLSTVPLSIL